MRWLSREISFLLARLVTNFFAVLAVTHPELIETAPRAVSVELDGTLTRGMTVVDQRRGLRGDPANAHVGYRIDAERALQVVLESLGVESQPG